MPLLTNNLDGDPFLALFTYGSFGEVSTRGAELAGRYAPSARWSLSASASFFDSSEDTAGARARRSAPDGELRSLRSVARIQLQFAAPSGRGLDRKRSPASDSTTPDGQRSFGLVRLKS